MEGEFKSAARDGMGVRASTSVDSPNLVGPLYPKDHVGDNLTAIFSFSYEKFLDTFRSQVVQRSYLLRKAAMIFGLGGGAPSACLSGTRSACAATAE